MNDAHAEAGSEGERRVRKGDVFVFVGTGKRFVVTETGDSVTLQIIGDPDQDGLTMRTEPLRVFQAHWAKTADDTQALWRREGSF